MLPHACGIGHESPRLSGILTLQNIGELFDKAVEADA
jgi:hypothetical protein